MKKLIIAVLSLTTAFTGVPAFAAPAFVQRPAVSSDMSTTNAAPVEKVEWRHHRNWGGPRGHYRGHHRGYYRDRYDRDRYYHRRHHNNAGAIIGGLAAGAIIGGALAAPRARTYTSHQAYCASKYRSYRAYDNTYQPNHGPRRQCR